MTMDAGSPAAGEARGKRSNRGRRIEKADHRWTAESIGDRRKKRERHAEDHRDEIDDIGTDQFLTAARVFESLDDGGDAWLFGVLGRRHRADHRQARQRRRVRRHIDEIRDGQPARCDQQSAHGRPGDHTDAAAHDRERCGRRQLVLLDEARNQRLDRGTLQPADGGHPRRNEIQEQRGRPPHRDDRECGTAGGERHVGDDRDTAPVHGIRHRPADEGSGEERHELDESEETHRKRGSGEPVHLVRQRDVGDHRADERHELRGVQQAIVAVAERGQVHVAVGWRLPPEII